jgi:hypothetical protein
MTAVEQVSALLEVPVEEVAVADEALEVDIR